MDPIFHAQQSMLPPPQVLPHSSGWEDFREVPPISMIPSACTTSVMFVGLSPVEELHHFNDFTMERQSSALTLRKASHHDQADGRFPHGQMRKRRRGSTPNQLDVDRKKSAPAAESWPPESATVQLPQGQGGMALERVGKRGGKKGSLPPEVREATKKKRQVGACSNCRLRNLKVKFEAKSRKRNGIADSSSAVEETRVIGASRTSSLAKESLYRLGFAAI